MRGHVLDNWETTRQAVHPFQGPDWRQNIQSILNSASPQSVVIFEDSRYLRGYNKIAKGSYLADARFAAESVNRPIHRLTSRAMIGCGLSSPPCHPRVHPRRSVEKPHCHNFCQRPPVAELLSRASGFLTISTAFARQRFPSQYCPTLRHWHP
jgi:hypothetical protein